MKKRNYFANKESSSFLNLVKMITENVDDETEGLDFEDSSEDMDVEDDDFDSDSLEDDMSEEADGDMVSIELPREVAQQLYDVLGMMLGDKESDNLEDADFDVEDEDADFDVEDEDADFDVEDEDADFDSDDEMADEFEEFDADKEADEETEIEEEDEEVLGSDQSNVAQSTISRDGAPKRSKANTSWNTGKTVKSVFDQTVSHEGEPAGTSRDGAPKRSKFSKEPNRSKTVSSRLQPGKHIFEIGK